MNAPVIHWVNKGRQKRYHGRDYIAVMTFDEVVTHEEAKEAARTHVRAFYEADDHRSQMSQLKLLTQHEEDPLVWSVYVWEPYND